MASTHKAILDHVAKSAISNGKIHLSTKVTAIESVDVQGEGSKVVVSTDDSVFEFDEVVITAPLGCLKRKTLTFSPPLPPAITRAIKNTSYSRLEKVYITFPSAFWDSADADCSESKTEFPSFAHFLHPTYSSSNPSSWTLELNTLSSPKIFGPAAQPTLLFTIYGACATHLTSLITNLSPSSPMYFTILNDFFQPYYSLLPNYDRSHPSCTPSAVLATDWQHDELAGCGSYMNFQVSEELQEGQEEVRLEEDIRALRQGMPERGIWLAGEHTAPFVALGTLTGAYWSGEAVAMRILGAHGLVGGQKAE